MNSIRLLLFLLLPGGVASSPAAELQPKELLRHLGAKGRLAGSPGEVAAYQQHFERIDRNQNGSLSHTEYVVQGTYFNERAREGIFRASDSDRDGAVSRDEYIVNRRITDEAKAIMARADSDRDGTITRAEFVASGIVKDESLRSAIFDRLDADGNGSTFTPEYLRAWGAWARAIPTGVAKGTGGGSAGGGAMRRSARPGPPTGGFPGGPPRGGRGFGPPDPAMLFDRFDRNGDGRLQQSEVPAGLWSRISARDADKDGTISRGEMQFRR